MSGKVKYTDRERRYVQRAVRLRDQLTDKALAARMGISWHSVRHLAKARGKGRG